MSKLVHPIAGTLATLLVASFWLSTVLVEAFGTHAQIIAVKLAIPWGFLLLVPALAATGGTGLTGRDVTVEAHRDVYEKEIDAFGTVFAVVSMGKIGTSAVQSRACGGVAGGTYLFALPGSPGACKDAWDGILLKQLDYRHMPCNFVEIMPRLDEHLKRNT